MGPSTYWGRLGSSSRRTHNVGGPLAWREHPCPASGSGGRGPRLRPNTQDLLVPSFRGSKRVSISHTRAPSPSKGDPAEPQTIRPPPLPAQDRRNPGAEGPASWGGTAQGREDRSDPGSAQEAPHDPQ